MMFGNLIVLIGFHLIRCEPLQVDGTSLAGVIVPRIGSDVPYEHHDVNTNNGQIEPSRLAGRFACQYREKHNKQYLEA
jgi:hypothetical protein